MKPVNKFFSDEHIAKIEEKYNAKYVIDACLQNKNGSWINFPAAIFYTEEAHPQGSNYMAFYWSEIHDGWMITDGQSAVKEPFGGFLFEDGELVHSRFRHDCFVHRDAMVDGGRDYFKSSANVEGARRINFKIEKDQIVEVQ
jgi:hypothetical protein